MHVQLARYVRYAELLRGASKMYERVLLTDVTDVLFQADPFSNLPEGELLCFLEVAGRTIGQSPVNTRWIKYIFGPEAAERLKSFEIVCSGTTIGTHVAMIHYIDQLLGHAKPEILVKLRRRGHDQGIHNYLLRTGALPNARLIPNGQHVYTMARVPDPDIGLGPNGTILASGRLCPIVHQYNYKPRVLEHVNAAFGITGDSKQ
jgi:hypothetical protein